MKAAESREKCCVLLGKVGTISKKYGPKSVESYKICATNAPHMEPVTVELAANLVMELISEARLHSMSVDDFVARMLHISLNEASSNAETNL